MSSTDAGTPAAGDGKPPAAPRERRGLRDRNAGRILLLLLVLGGAFLAARTCGAADRNVSQTEAIEIAKENADFEPCAQQQCVQVRYVQRGIPVRAYWGVVLSERLDEEGEPNRVQTFLIDVTTGDLLAP